MNKSEKYYKINLVNLTFALHAPKGAPLTKPLTGLEARKKPDGAKVVKD